MEKFSVRISPLFVAFSFVLIYLGWLQQFLIYFVALCCHELGHYVVAKLYGYNLNKIIFMPYGAGLQGDSKILNYKHEIVIALAGPVVNIFFVVVCVACWWVWPFSYEYTMFFVYSNISLAVFNLLPVFPLDGGRVLVCYIKQKHNQIFAYKIMKILGIVFSIAFAILFVVSVFYGVNLSYFFISVFLFFASFGNNANIFFERTQVCSLENTKSKACRVKCFAVSKQVSIHSMIKYIKSDYYTIFYIVENGKVLYTLTEQELMKKIEQNI